MTEQEQLTRFTDDLLQEVLSLADSDGDGSFRIDAFTQIFGDYIIESGEVDELNICFYKARGMQMNGYSVSMDEDCIDLYISVFNQQVPPVNVPKAQIDAAFRQAENCLKKGFSGFYQSLEEASETYDAFLRMYELREQVTRCRIYLLTDGLVNKDEFSIAGIQNLAIEYNIWDIRRLFRFSSSGQRFESIEIDFMKSFGKTIPCLPLVAEESDYKGFLAAIPGEILASVYDRYGPRLLERNVRSFLQARGKVNKGIRKTILEEPHRFFAYNNGITATADFIEFCCDNEATMQIKKIRNLQIVNGGQTTASLYHTAKKDKADLKGIYVQAKLSVIPEKYLEEIVPLISRYANSQNKVNDADFFANDPFHIRIEELSRTVWAPAVDGSMKQTHWFYERARGQYMDAKAREITPARKRQFETVNPRRQKFTKTDLAKFENTWMQLPHIVSLGAQKNFNDYSVRLRGSGRVEPDVHFFESLIAKAILFKVTEKIVSEQKYGGYRANIVTYTIAWISHNTAQRVDLDKIWKTQDLSQSLREAIRIVSNEVFKVIINPPNLKNVTEWCKRKDCWDKIRTLKLALPEGLKNELIDIRKTSSKMAERTSEDPNTEDSELISKISMTSPEQWFQISKWAKETSNLQPWQRSLSYSIGRILNSGKSVSPKQARQGIKVLSEAERLGFRVN